MLKLGPPHGWLAMIWELGIVTLGVLIALAAQQWAEERSWRAKVDQSRAAIRDELAKHYSWSVEWRTVKPCVIAQIDQLRQRIERSGSRLEPAPVYSDDAIAHFVLRMPSKDYADGAWKAAISDGVAPRFDPALRGELNDHYMQAATVQDEAVKNTENFMSLQTLSRPVLLDPMVRYTLLERLDVLLGRAEFMDLQAGQLIDHIEKVRMVPDADNTAREVKRFGTYRFCKAHRLPMRPFAEAMKAIAN